MIIRYSLHFNSNVSLNICSLSGIHSSSYCSFSECVINVQSSFVSSAVGFSQ